MIALVAVQGVSVSYFAARGPAHTHREVPRIAVLEDVRRVGPSATQGHSFQEWPGHSHQTSWRHHHPSADPSVVLDPDNAAFAATEDGTLAHDLAIAAFVAVLVLAFRWTPAVLSQQRAVRASWQPSFVTARLLERPPQAI
ncbi:MAG: hypothetical protein M3Z16_01980 [Pseudomonadota bacterium]|nr:hypothetical protein [Pseudomonadota bacterium]